MSIKTILKDLGEIRYKEAWDYQEILFKELLDAKKKSECAK